MPFNPGDVIDEKYRIVRLIGEGGMGYVYEGVNTRIGRRVAIKVLNADIAASDDMKRRFEREAQVAAKIGSPHICDVLDLGDLPSGECYLVMELLEGEGLDVLITRRVKVPPEELSVLAYQMLEGLASMHDAGIIHRDVKPANAFIARSVSAGTAREVVKLLDFGISKFQDDAAQKHVTQTGALLGTPVYMSPEQARGERGVDGRSDIYSVGVILYRALTGELPFNGDNFQQLLFKIALEPPPSLAERAPEVDEIFRGIVEKAMAKSPEDRFASAREFQQAIVQWARTQGRSSMSFQRAVGSSPTPLTADVVAAAAAVTGANRSPAAASASNGNGDIGNPKRAGLDEKSAPVAWGKPSAADALPSKLQGDLAFGLTTAEARTPPPAGSDTTLIDAAVERSKPKLDADENDASPVPAAGLRREAAQEEKEKRRALPLFAVALVIGVVGVGVTYKQFSRPADAATSTSVTSPSLTSLGSARPPTPDGSDAIQVAQAPTASATSSAAAPPGSAASGSAIPPLVNGSRTRGGNIVAAPRSSGGAGAQQTAAPSTPDPIVNPTMNPAPPPPGTASADPAKAGRKIRTEL